MRIDKILSEMGIATRSEARAAASRGGVLVNGEPVRDLSRHVDPSSVRITYLGREIGYNEFAYVMLNKPEGYVSATEDSKLPTVIELLPDELRKRELFPVGRLDRDTTGLMILTNDGKLAHSVLSPRHHVSKVYFFTAAEPMAEGVEDYFREGVTLKDGYECKSAEIVLASDRLSGHITLIEGKYHQIKRMVAASGNRVTSLRRISFAGIMLDESLGAGEWRMLTDREVALLTEHR